MANYIPVNRSNSEKEAIPGCNCSGSQHRNIQAARDTLRKLTDTFIIRCEANDITPGLFSNLILSQTDRSTIEKLGSRKERGLTLVDMLLNCTNAEWFDILLKNLSCELAYGDITEALHTGYVQRSIPTDSSFSSIPREKIPTKQMVRRKKQASVSEGAMGKRTFVLVGVTGSGKSTLGNFLIGEDIFEVEEAFANSQAVTNEVISHEFDFGTFCIRLIDMPGLENSMKPYEYSKKFAEALIEAKEGIDAILLCSKCNDRIGDHEEIFTKIFEALGQGHNIWDYCLLVLTEGQKAGKIESQRMKKLFNQVAQGKVHPLLKDWLEKVQNRCVIVESVNYPGEDYRTSKLREIIGMVNHMRLNVTNSTPLKMDIVELVREICDNTRTHHRLMNTFEPDLPSSSNSEKSEEEIKKESGEIVAKALQSLGENIPEDADTGELKYDMVQQRIHHLLEVEQESRAQMNQLAEKEALLEQKQSRLEAVENQRAQLEEQLQRQKKFLKSCRRLTKSKLYQI